jgi:hypothetical protein
MRACTAPLTSCSCHRLNQPTSPARLSISCSHTRARITPLGVAQLRCAAQLGMPNRPSCASNPADASGRQCRSHHREISPAVMRTKLGWAGGHMNQSSMSAAAKACTWGCSRAHGSGHAPHVHGARSERCPMPVLCVLGCLCSAPQAQHTRTTAADSTGSTHASHICAYTRQGIAPVLHTSQAPPDSSDRHKHLACLCRGARLRLHWQLPVALWCHGCS